MNDREELIKILSVPIYLHEQVNPIEGVTDYLLNNDVVPVVRCKNCKFSREWSETDTLLCYKDEVTIHIVPHNHFCSYGEV